jgi:glycine/D-amino acid oxidase-like deaminating enzyme
MSLPHPKPVPTFWTSTPHHLDNHISTPTLPSTADVVIIGSGFAGAATAYHLYNSATHAPPKTTVLLEARQITSGATGRNGGHVKPDTYAGLTRYASLYGLSAAAALQQFEAEQVYAIKHLVESEGLDCDFQLTRACDAIMDKALAEKYVADYAALVARGEVQLRDVTCHADPAVAERVSGVKGAKAAFTFTAAHLWPRKMVMQLLERVVQRGLLLYTHTPVLECVRDSEGLWVVKTRRGAVRARKVVFCTNAYTGALLPQYQEKIVPVRGVCCRITTPKGMKAPHLPCTYSLRFDATQYDYLIPRLDGSIVVGGARAIFWHERDSWYGNSNDGELVKDGEKYFEGYMQKYFHGWDDSGASLDTIWSGIMGFSSDLVPHIGQVPGAPGQYVCAGFSGHGMPQILTASKAITRMVAEDISYEETGLPGLFKTTAARLENKVNHLKEALKVNWEGPHGRKEARL